MHDEVIPATARAYDALSSALAGRYSIERELGHGGMATVYLAHDLKHDRKVALKVLKPELAAVIGAERFLAEIKTTANLQHPHILAALRQRTGRRHVFYAMPFVEGESLRDRLSREKQLPVDTALRIATEIADALRLCARHGVVHRDIKPENILVHGGHALVADFGISLAASNTADAPHRNRDEPRYADVHESRASDRRSRDRRTQRRLLSGGGALRDARRRCAVCRRHRTSDHRESLDREGAERARGSPERSGVRRWRDRARAREASRGSLRNSARVLRGTRGARCIERVNDGGRRTSVSRLSKSQRVWPAVAAALAVVLRWQSGSPCESAEPTEARLARLARQTMHRSFARLSTCRRVSEFKTRFRVRRSRSRRKVT